MQLSEQRKSLGDLMFTCDLREPGFASGWTATEMAFLDHALPPLY